MNPSVPQKGIIPKQENISWPKVIPRKLLLDVEPSSSEDMLLARWRKWLTRNYLRWTQAGNDVVKN